MYAISASAPWKRAYRNYLSQSDAVSKNLTYANGDTLIIRADSTTVLSADGPGRDSVRLQSNKQYSNHVSVCVVLYSYHERGGAAGMWGWRRA